MTEVIFYAPTLSPLEKALPKVLEKVYKAKLKIHVRTLNDARREFLNKLLWTYHPQSFLPHGSIVDGCPEQQPIWLSTQEDNMNNAEVLVLVDHVFQENIDTYVKCLYFSHQHTTSATAIAKSHWHHYKKKGHSCSMWLQNTQGGWEKCSEFVT